MELFITIPLYNLTIFSSPPFQCHDCYTHVTNFEILLYVLLFRIEIASHEILKPLEIKQFLHFDKPLGGIATCCSNAISY